MWKSRSVAFVSSCTARYCGQQADGDFEHESHVGACTEMDSFERFQSKELVSGEVRGS